MRRPFVLGTALGAFITMTISFLFFCVCLPFPKQLTADQDSPKKKKKEKMLTSHPSKTTITGQASRIDTGAVATLTGCAGELHAVMAHHCLVSAWMRDHAISTAGCSVMAPAIMRVSMAKEDSRLRCTKTGNWRHWSCPSKLIGGGWQILKSTKKKGLGSYRRRPAAQIKPTGFHGASRENSAVRH